MTTPCASTFTAGEPALQPLPLTRSNSATPAACSSGVAGMTPVPASTAPAHGRSNSATPAVVVVPVV